MLSTPILEKTQKTLHLILESPILHARWLNSLSYLEYRGFRKIVRSQDTDAMNLERLNHTFEEVRHAIFFKRFAIKQGGPSYDSYQEPFLLAGAATKKYFWDLDGGVSEKINAFKNSKIKNAAYYLITLLIEQRALWLYHIYHTLLESLSLASRKKGVLCFSLQSLLREETQHFQEVTLGSSKILEEEGLKQKPTLESFKKIEEKAFTHFWNEIAKETLAFHSTQQPSVTQFLSMEESLQ